MQNCYNTGERIPREKKFDVDDRLANKHIQTLQFVQEVVNENKVLKKKVDELEEAQLHCDELHALAEESKEKIKTIQEQYLKRADEINAMMAEKHRDEMMKVVQEKLDLEKTLSENIVQLKQEVSQLENTNRELIERIQELSGSHDQIEVLNSEIEDQKRIIANLNLEIDTLKTQNEHLSGEKTSQFSQLQNMQSLKSQNMTLVQDLKAMDQKNIELMHKISHLEAQLKEATSSKEHVELIDNLKTKLAKLHKERSVAVEKEEFYQKQIGDLRYEVETLKEKVQSAEVTKDRVLEEYYKVLSELQYLKRNYSNDSNSKNFKDFVKLKREVAVLREENEEFKRGLKPVTSSSSATSLPMLRFEVDAPIRPGGTKKGHKPKKALSLTSN